MSEERIVSEKTLGSSNPVARFGRKLGDSVRGIIFGLILIVVGFGLMWYAEKQPEYSKVVTALPLTEVAQTTGSETGLLKVGGTPTAVDPFKYQENPQPLLYYRKTVEELKKVKKVSTETRVVQQNGQDVEQTVEKTDYVDEWVMASDESKWTDFSMGKVAVRPGTYAPDAQLLTVFSQEERLTGAQESPKAGDRTPDMDPPTKRRTTVVVLPANIKLLVVGEVVGGVITGGTPFVVTDKSNDQLVASMKSGESKMYWGMKIAAWLFMTIGFLMLFGPIAAFLDILPGLGGLFNTVLFVAFGILSAVIVALGTVVIRYWWAILILLVVLIVVGIMRRKK